MITEIDESKPLTNSMIIKHMLAIDIAHSHFSKNVQPYQRDFLHAMKQKGKIRILKKRVM